MLQLLGEGQLDFYKTRAWRELRYRVLDKHGKKCQACGRNDPKEKYHVDHIKPRSKYPELELDFNNLQILCEDCNRGKGNMSQTDWAVRDLETRGELLKLDPEIKLLQVLLERRRRESSFYERPRKPKREKAGSGSDKIERKDNGPDFL